MFRKYGLLILILLAGVGLLFALIWKDNLNELISQQIKKQTTAEEKFSAEQYINTHFDYKANHWDFEYTLIEFKSSGCTICKLMQPELELIKNWEELKVNVVVIQVMNPDSQEMMKYYGISAVPTHLLLAKNGNEFYRKYGFISADELKAEMRISSRTQNSDR